MRNGIVTTLINLLHTMLSILLRPFRKEKPILIPYLPVELIILIVEFSRENRKTIEACSLVCRAWLPAAHAVLFEHIMINAAEDLQETIDTKVARIGRYVNSVRALTLKRRNPFAESRVSLPTVRVVTSRFPNLKELEIVQLWLHHHDLLPPSLIPETPRSTQVSTVGSLKTLKLVTACLDYPQEDNVSHMFYELLASFPTLEHFIYNYTTCQKTDIIPDITQLVLPPLRTLSCRSMGRNFPMFLRSLQPVVWQLKTIDYTGRNTFLNNFILLCEPKGIKDSLENLRFAVSLPEVRHNINIIDDTLVSEKDHAERCWNTLELQTFTALRTIHIVINKGWFHTHLHILQALPPTIRTLAFELCWIEPGSKPQDCLNGLTLLPFENVIGNSLPDLTEIFFMPHHLEQELGTDAQMFIRTQLADLDARGLLRIVNRCDSERLEDCQYERPKPPTSAIVGGVLAYGHPKLDFLWVN
ncbi:hypothetical protein QCA50_010261 [Cerrena zonata]|uniref:F-box domain-containing protein n=1 Tax=Cerrena zonata TaxID=2478898 RepID=A0AAW0G0A0_9APHY